MTITKDQQQPKQKPRDGPATVFEADPMVSDIFTCRDGDYFGLVLVTNWPVSPLADMDGPYQHFLGAVKSCFQTQDIAPSNDTRTSSESPSSLPSVYLYPTIHLHITLATFVPPKKITGSGNSNDASGPADETNDKDLRNAKRAEALKLVRSASKLQGWPTKPLQLVVDSAQIGKRAGILLWKDLSGGVDAIRNCLRQAHGKANANATANRTSSTSKLPSIPGIIHSTFLRFSSVPQTPGEQVQEIFRSKIAGKLGTEFFSSTNQDTDADADTAATTPLVIQAKTVRLVLESTPYMHMPNDDEHVLWTTELAPAR